MKKPQDTHLHFVGIGGIGMSGIAQVFANQGYRVTGSDLSESENTKRLSQSGAKVLLGHSAAHVQGADVVVISSAVSSSNPEVVEAKRLRIPVIPRAEMLGELMRGKIGLAVAGSHGKTTTTSMLGWILFSAGVDPTIVVGGRVKTFEGNNALWGRGAIVVAEADESDGSFLHLPATYGAITNIDSDHLDHFGTLDRLRDAFVDFVGNMPFYGVTAVCVDDPGVRACLARFTKPVVTYGLSDEAEVRAVDVRLDAGGSKFFVSRRNPGLAGASVLGEVELHLPGQHNVLNALGALTLAERMGVSFPKIQAALKSFQGVRRRFDVRFRGQDHAVVDDYGHHPSEIRATLQAAKQFWPGRIVTVFQPHRYSRTALCFEEFKGAFEGSDLTLISDIYAAGEPPIEGITSASLAQAVVGAGARHSGDLEATLQLTLSLLEPGDLVLCMGAGSITSLPDRIIASGRLR